MIQQPNIEILTVQKATAKIATQLEELHGKCFEKGWDAETFKDFLDSAHVDAILARYKSTARLLGFILLRWASVEAEFLSIAVDPRLRKTGIAKSICAEGVNQLKTKGVREIYLEVNQSNSPAIELYKSLGFRRIGLRKCYYSVGESGEYSDAICMKLDILEINAFTR